MIITNKKKSNRIYIASRLNLFSLLTVISKLNVILVVIQHITYTVGIYPLDY